MALWFEYQLRAVEAMFAAYCPECWGAKEPAVRDEPKVFEVCVAADLNCADLAAVIVQPTAVLAETEDQAKLLGLRMADAAQKFAKADPLDVSRLTVLVRPFA